jgi:solute carrier family 26 (sodium-independent sulfate anion transporter), member 11
VNNIDVTSMQQLIDTRNQLDRHAYPNKVDWHFAHINNRWTKRALASVGFGHPTPGSRLAEQWKSIYSVADIGGAKSAVATTGESELSITSIYNSSPLEQPRLRMAVVHGLNRPFFHIDLTSALESAIANVEFRRDLEVKGEPHRDV